MLFLYHLQSIKLLLKMSCHIHVFCFFLLEDICNLEKLKKVKTKIWKYMKVSWQI